MHCTDDRGTRVKLIPKHQLSTLLGVQSPMPKSVRQAINTDSRQSFDSTEVLALTVMGGIGSLFLCALVAFIAWPLIFFVGPTSFITGLCVLLAISVAVIAWMSMRWAHRRAIETIVDHGICPSCGYSLRSITPAHDGCTVCPECGSAWRIPAAKDE